MKCRLCGKQLPLGTAECDNCGAQVEWKKYIWLTAVVTALAVALVAGLVCGIVLGIQEKPAENTEPPATENPTEATPEPTQTEPTEGTQPTEPTTESTEPPTEPTTEITYDTTWMDYIKTPDTFMAIRYSESDAYDYPGKAFDTSNMVEGAFYAIDDGDVYLITEQYVSTWFVTSEHIYFVLQDDAGKVLRTDHYGQNQTVVHEYGYGGITLLQYYGTDSDGTLILLTNQKRIVEIYLTQKYLIRELVSAYLVNFFSYYPQSVFCEELVTQFGNEDLGPVVYWNGRLTKRDTEDHFYYFFYNSGQCWDTNTGEIVTISHYDSLPNNLSAWIHSTDNQWYYDKYGLNTSSCVEGWLYIFNAETGEPTLICDETVTRFDVNSKYIFYVTEENPQTVIRSTLEGKDKVAFNTGCNITHLDWCGGINGSLCLVDNRTDIVAYDIVTGTKTVIYSYHDVNNADISNWEFSRWIAFDAADGYWQYNIDTGEMLQLDPE